MKWIDSSDLKNWAGRRDCQEALPYLVRKLIRASIAAISEIRFPSGDNISSSGWDGVLVSEKGTHYVPEGQSLWEFGTNKDIKGKADEEFKKRSGKPLGYDPAQSTFVFVTPRVWSKSTEWVQEKKKEAIWKGVRVITAQELEEWLDDVPTVGCWLAVKHLRKYPQAAVQPVDDFWEEWSTGPKFNLSPELVIGGRNESAKILTKSINRTGLIVVQGNSRDEALAFIIASFLSSEFQEDFLSRSLIVDGPEEYRSVSIRDNKLLLIPRFEDFGVINRAVKNHLVVVPIGPDSASNWQEKVVLPRIVREAFILALTKDGLTNTQAENLSRESARNLTILRRQQQFDRHIPRWASQKFVLDIVPSLLAGYWNDESDDDKLIVSILSKQSYEAYSAKLRIWASEPDSPIINIRNVWRLASPLDAWANASKFLTRTDFELLRQVVVKVLTEVHPAFDLEPEKRYMSSLYGKKRKFSQHLREGLSQSLILISLFGDKLEFDLPLSSDAWIGQLVRELLTSNDPYLWKSLDDAFPLLAEASPSIFLEMIERKSGSERELLRCLFDEDPSLITKKSYHTGILWALEGIAWHPKYLSRSALLLAQLAVIDPDPKSNYVNRPFNSLVEIFKPWHRQTIASLSERMDVLHLIVRKYPEPAWNLLIKLLPNNRDTAMPTHKFRWRYYDEVAAMPAFPSDKEIIDTHRSIVEMLISIFDASESKALTLIKESESLDQEEQNKILTLIEKASLKISPENELWNGLREIISHHRSYPDTDWALPSHTLNRYENLYHKLTPENKLDQLKWIFDYDHWPHFIEGFNHQGKSYEEQEQLIAQRRVQAIEAIVTNWGTAKLLSLAPDVRLPNGFGEAIAYVVEDSDFNLKFCEFLSKTGSELATVQSFVRRKIQMNGFDWIRDLYGKVANTYGSEHLSKLLVALPPSEELWDFIDSRATEIQIGYWREINPWFFRIQSAAKLRGIRSLIQVGRSFTAQKVAGHFVNELPTDLLVDVLVIPLTIKASEDMDLHEHTIETLLRALDHRSDVNEEELFRIEWLYLPLLVSYGSGRKPKLLHTKMSEDANFFIDVIKGAYRPDDETLITLETEGLTEDQILNRATACFKLLHSWKRIPGTREDGEVDFKFMQEWVERVRQFGVSSSRVAIVDHYIGTVLAHYPEGNGSNWPPDQICEILESVNNEEVLSGFSVATSNKRGSSIRPAFAGGEIERGHAKYFSDLAMKIRNRYPVVANVLDKLAQNYEWRAKREDDEAELNRLRY